jgi:hypothetical protein
LRFEYYSKLTPAKCVSALQGRIEQNETATRPAMTGNVDKNGFAVTITTPVIRNFRRSTGIKATFERDKGITVINGYVNTGASRKQQIMVFIGGLLVGLALIARGMFIQGVAIMTIGAYFYIPLQGDAKNSDYLIKQIRTLLKAKTRDPR